MLVLSEWLVKSQNFMPSTPTPAAKQFAANAEVSPNLLSPGVHSHLMVTL